MMPWRPSRKAADWRPASRVRRFVVLEGGKITLSLKSEPSWGQLLDEIREFTQDVTGSRCRPGRCRTAPVLQILIKWLCPIFTNF